MSPRSIRRRVEARYQQAGLRKLTAHDFRKTFLSELMASGADAMQARRIAGHSSVATTQATTSARTAVSATPWTG